jgi:alanine racemase
VTPERPLREAVIDLDAVRSNVTRLRELVGAEHTMAVVKANGYGHGAVPVARAALEGGADLLGVADVREGIELRDAGIDAPVLAWLHDPGLDFAPAIARRIAVGVSSVSQLEAVADAANRTGRIPSVHLKLDTGLSRNGVARPEWREVFRAAYVAQRDGVLAVDGVFSHVSGASAADDLAAREAFDIGLRLASEAGLAPRFVHLASTAPALTLPQTRYNTVRLGIGIYGLSPVPERSAARLGLRPAMTVRTRVAAVRRAPAGTGVSYGYTYRTDAETTLALVPLGYADGVPRQASGRGEVAIGGHRFPIAGRIAMDQFVVDVADHPVAIGDEVVLFGDPATGVPTATEWALAADTIDYEIVTRIGGRVERTYRGDR